jgi:hypothetical protein
VFKTAAARPSPESIKSCTHSQRPIFKMNFNSVIYVFLSQVDSFHSAIVPPQGSTTLFGMNK